MATNITMAKSSRRVFSKILGRLQRGVSYTTRADGQLGSMRLRQTVKRVWTCSADPLVATGELLGACQIGDFVYREDTDEAFICSVAPLSTAGATFIQLHA